MNSSLFRKKSIDKVSSPDVLDSYMKVTGPSVWIILVSIILVLAGAIIWSFSTMLETGVKAVTVSDGTSAICYVSQDYIIQVDEDAYIKIEDDIYKIDHIDEDCVYAETVLNAYCLNLGDMEAGEYVYAITLSNAPDRGNYGCRVIIDQVSPITFLISSEE